MAPRKGVKGSPTFRSCLAPGSLRFGVSFFPLALGGGMRRYVPHLLPWMVRRSAHRFLLLHGPQGQPSVGQTLGRLGPAERNRVLPMSFEDRDRILRHADAFDLLLLSAQLPLSGPARPAHGRRAGRSAGALLPRMLHTGIAPDPRRPAPHTARDGAAALRPGVDGRRDLLQGAEEGFVALVGLRAERFELSPENGGQARPPGRRRRGGSHHISPARRHGTGEDRLARRRADGVDANEVAAGRPL
jgi:hypothetical protein